MKHITLIWGGLVGNVKQVLETFPVPEMAQYSEKIAALDPKEVEEIGVSTIMADSEKGYNQSALYASGATVNLSVNEETAKLITPHLEQYLSVMKEIHDNRELMEREPNLEAYLSFSIAGIRHQLSESADALDWMHDIAWERACDMFFDLEKVPTSMEAGADPLGISADYFSYLHAVNEYYDGLDKGIPGEELSARRLVLLDAADRIAAVPKEDMEAWLVSGYGGVDEKRRRATTGDTGLYNEKYGLAKAGSQLDEMSIAMARGFTPEEIYCLRSFIPPAESALKDIDVSLGQLAPDAETFIRDVKEIVQTSRECLQTGFLNVPDKRTFFEEYYEALASLSSRMEAALRLQPPTGESSPVYRDSYMAINQFRSALLTAAGPIARVRSEMGEQFLREIPEAGLDPERDSFTHMEFLRGLSAREIDVMLQRSLPPERYQIFAEFRDREIDNIVRLNQGNVTDREVRNDPSRWIPGVVDIVFSDPETTKSVYREIINDISFDRSHRLVTTVRGYDPAAQRAAASAAPDPAAADPLISKHAYDMTPEQRDTFRRNAGQWAAGRSGPELQHMRNKLDLIDIIENPEKRVWTAGDLLEKPVFSQGLLARLHHISEDMALVTEVCEDMTRENGFDQPDEFFPCDSRDFERMIQFPPEMTENSQKKNYARQWINRFLDVPEGRRQCLDEFFDRVDQMDQRKFDLRCFSKNGDPTPVQADGLTASEHDFIDSLWLFGCTQTRSKKGVQENPQYFNNRYQTERSRMLFRTAADRDITCIPYYMNIMDVNGYSFTNVRPKQTDVLMNLQNTVSRVELGYEVYERRKSAAQGMEYPSAISVNLYDGKYTDPAQYRQWLGVINSALRGVEAGGRLTDGAVSFMYDVYLDNTDNAGLKNKEKEDLNSKFGLDDLDSLFVDGKPLKEYVGKKYGDLEKAGDAGKTFIEQAMCSEFILAAMSGKHRTEMAEIHIGPDGSYQVKIAEYKLNSHLMDETEKQTEHSSTRRFFDFAATKIETRADKQDKLWEQDPDKEKRQEEIRTRMSEKIVKSFYAKENERERSAYESRKAAEAAAAADEPELPTREEVEGRHRTEEEAAATDEPELPTRGEVEEKHNAPEAPAAAKGKNEPPQRLGKLSRTELEAEETKAHPKEITESKQHAAPVKNTAEAAPSVQATPKEDKAIHEITKGTVHRK